MIPKINSPLNMSQYVSCIKINGRPILPPLMTGELRNEMRIYKELAMDVEKRIKNRRRCSVSSDNSIRAQSTPARPATLNLSGFRNTLENRLALDSESETESEKKRWSPLQVDSLNDLRLQMSLDSDSTQDTPDTVTASPKLQRQGSYTILEPRILSKDDLTMFLDFDSKRSNSGRKTWDLRHAKEQWSNMNPVPSSYRVPFDSSETTATVPSVRQQLSSLSEMMITLKLKHEQQRRELEMKQAAEEEEYEKLFTFKQRQILQFVGSARENMSLPDNDSRLAQSDTDIDVSFVDDSCPIKVDDLESWSCSSMMSNEPVKETPRIVCSRREYSSPERKRRNEAATKICAAARGYLTRRLMRSETVRTLRRSLMDSIHVCESLQLAPDDLGSSDVKFMSSLKRQIFSDWDALYEIFMLKPLSEQLEIIASDRERLRAQKKMPESSARRMSAATLKSLQRKQKIMSSSLTLPRSPSFKRSCFKMSTSLSGALPPRCK